ncbi:MAG: glycosyl hydrolase, partial [Pseudonocardiales bacterium]|nr:glycosyl hydrolase [Pseudonocardiales bacterium]
GVVVAVAAVAAGVYVVDQVSFPEIDEPSLLAVVPPAPDLPAVVVAPAGGEATATPEPTTEAPVVEAEPEETEEPAPSRAPSRRAGAAPGGLPWHSGVVVGTPDEVAGWEDYRGRQVDVVHGFAARGAWDDITSAGWIMGYYSDFPGIVVISQPFWPEDSGGSLDACAGGAYDDQWAEYGRTLADHPGMDVYTRLAWEFNGTWFEWSATDAEAWKSCFRSVVDAVRSTAPDARFEWNINAHGSQSCDGDAWNCWPGDEYVDVVGIDPYDHYPSSATAAEFDEQCNDRHGLCYVIDFAREHGKEVGVTEWGVINSGIGDNPLYIEKMYETFEAGSDVMAYETYFNSADHNTTLDGGENPESSAAYRELFGG